MGSGALPGPICQSFTEVARGVEDREDFGDGAGDEVEEAVVAGEAAADLLAMAASQLGLDGTEEWTSPMLCIAASKLREICSGVSIRNAIQIVQNVFEVECRPGC